MEPRTDSWGRVECFRVGTINRHIFDWCSSSPPRNRVLAGKSFFNCKDVLYFFGRKLITKLVDCLDGGVTRSKQQCKPVWVTFFFCMSGYMGIAIRNVRLHENLQYGMSGCMGICNTYTLVQYIVQ